MPLLTLQSAKGYGWSSLVDVGPTTSYDSIATITLSAATSEVTFTSIPSTYKHLQIRATMMCSAVNNMFMRVGSGSIDTSSIYMWHQLYGNNASALSNGSSGNFGYIGYNHNTAYPNPSIIDIADYNNTSKFKSWKAIAGTDTNNASGGQGYVQLWGGSWASTSAIDTVRLTTGSGNFNQHSSFALYGIRG